MSLGWMWIKCSLDYNIIHFSLVRFDLQNTNRSWTGPCDSIKKWFKYIQTKFSFLRFQFSSVWLVVFYWINSIHEHLYLLGRFDFWKPLCYVVQQWGSVPTSHLVWPLIVLRRSESTLRMYSWKSTFLMVWRLEGYWDSTTS